MSIFKTKGIILKVDKTSTKWGNNSFSTSNKSEGLLYTIFTKDYWKIKCNKKISKTEKTLDLWYVVNFEIITKENVSIHKIRNIKIVSEFDYKDKSFKELNNYLILLSIILKKSPFWYPIYELFNLIELINVFDNIGEIKLILLKLKVISILWELNENNKDVTISKILKFINWNKVEKILKLTWIDENLKKELEILNF